jgi:hypothetical protein
MLVGMVARQVARNAIPIVQHAVAGAPQTVKHVRRMPSSKGPSQTNVSVRTRMEVQLQTRVHLAIHTANTASSLPIQVELNAKLTHL